MNSETQNVSAEAARIIARCRELAGCTEVAGETTRTFLSPAMRQAHALVGGWMGAAGMQVHVDSVGNLRGVVPSTEPNAPRLIIGSHLDTVANAGAFDGPLGVVLGIAIVEQLLRDSSATRLPFEIEVIGFSEEEGVRFAKPFLGSLALIGELDAATLSLTDRDGISVSAAIRNFGLDPAQLPEAVIDDSASAYLEFHIEQGPMLESEGHALGVVEAIVGQTRMEFVFTGQANHAGTTPMGPLRHDALAAAAQWIVEVERFANGHAGLVSTVGKVESSSGAGNIIAGKFTATLDVRHHHDEARRIAIHHFIDCAQTAAAVRGVSVSHTTSIDQSAVWMSFDLSGLLAAAATRVTGTAPRMMTSGAGHDAMIVARRLPSAMLFLRSPGGLSHHPDEAVLPQDVVAALAAGLEFLRILREDRAMLQRIAVPTPSRKREDAHA